MQNKNTIHQPLKPFIINQLFGENKACVDIATNSKYINCDGLNPPDGYRSIYGPFGHQGVDLRAYHGQEVSCVQGGVVESIDTQPRTGLDVRVVSVINGKKMRHIYEHLLGYQKKVGDKIETGELVGWADNTGYSSGDHLHLELQEWDGIKWKSVDPMLYMSDLYAKDVLYFNNKLKYITEQIASLSDKFADYLRRSSK